MKAKHDKKIQISNRQLTFLIIQVTVGAGALSLPRTVSKVSKQDSWLPVLIGGLMWMLALYIIFKLGNRFPEDTIIEYSDKILGRWLGKIISVSYIIYGALITAIATRLFITILTSYILPKTPILITMSSLLLTAYYLVTKGLKVLARLYEFLFFLLSFTFLVITPIFFRIDWINFRPFLGTGIKNIIQGSYVTSYSYLGPEILLLIFPFISQKQKIWKSSAAGIGIVTLTYLYLVIATIGYYGIETLQFIIWPVINILKAVRIPFFGRVEFFFVFLWIGIGFTTIAAYLYLTTFSLTRLLPFKNKDALGLITIPVIIYIAFLPQNVNQVFDYTLLLAQFGTALTFIAPLFLLITAKIRGIRGRPDE